MITLLHCWKDYEFKHIASILCDHRDLHAGPHTSLRTLLSTEDRRGVIACPFSRTLEGASALILQYEFRVNSLTVVVAALTGYIAASCAAVETVLAAPYAAPTTFRCACVAYTRNPALKPIPSTTLNAAEGDKIRTSSSTRAPTSLPKSRTSNMLTMFSRKLPGPSPGLA